MKAKNEHTSNQVLSTKGLLATTASTISSVTGMNGSTITCVQSVVHVWVTKAPRKQLLASIMYHMTSTTYDRTIDIHNIIWHMPTNTPKNTAYWQSYLKSTRKAERTNLLDKETNNNHRMEMKTTSSFFLKECTVSAFEITLWVFQKIWTHEKNSVWPEGAKLNTT